MTWVLYHQTVDSMEGAAKRKFLMEAEDWAGLRAHDKASMKEGDQMTGGRIRGNSRQG